MSDSDHLVFVSQRFPPDKGGNAARIHDLARNISDEMSVTVLCPPPSYPPGTFEPTRQRKQTETVENVTVNRLWSWQPQSENPSMRERLAYYVLFGVHAMLWLFVHRNEYDAVITSTPPISTGAPGLVAASLGKPWIVDVRDLWIDASVSLGYLEAGSLIERVSRRFQRRALHSADRVAVTTERLGTTLAETYGSGIAAKTVVIPNGVDTETFVPETNPENQTQMESEMSSAPMAATTTDRPGSSEARTPGETSEDESTIIYTGNLGAAQDLESFIHAMTFLSGDVRLRIVGSGDLESELKQLAADLDVDDQVTFEGVVAREEVPELLTEATVGIAPLRSDDEFAYAMPTKVYEYMAAGLPVVVTGTGEIEQFIRETEGGIHVENDPKRIAAELEALLADPEKRRELGSRGRESVETNFSRELIAKRLRAEVSLLIESERVS